MGSSVSAAHATRVQPPSHATSADRTGRRSTCDAHTSGKGALGKAIYRRPPSRAATSTSRPSVAE